MEEKVKRGLLILLMCSTLLPVVQKCLPFVTSGPLYGYFDMAPDFDFSWKDWWSGAYRDEKDKYLNDQVGFRADLIRINNQVDYSLFGRLHFYPNMLGPDHVLWDNSYAEAYLGLDYIGYGPMQQTLVKLKKIQDTLAAMGKSLIFINAPCKGYFYPDNLPPHLAKLKKRTTNLETCIHICDSLGINQIDFNGWFVSLKNKTPQLLYPKQGIHWSVYGAALAADSTVKYMERLTHFQMPGMYWNKIVEQQNALFTDDDLSKPLNLIYSFNKEVFSYPQIEYITDSTKKRPNVIYIGDSFFCQWLYLGIPDHINSDWQYWIHFDGIANKKYEYGRTDCPRIKSIEWVAEINKSDCIVLIYTAKNLPTFGSEFIDHAYEHYFPGK